MTTIPSPHATSGAFSPLYDAWNRMVHVDNNTSPAQTNEYDGLNRRIVKIDKSASPDVTYNYYYNQQWQVVEIRKDEDTDPWKQYVYHPHYVDAVAMRLYDANTDGQNVDEHYYLQDANFNVTAMVESDGDVAERYDYTPYGEVTVLETNYTADPDNQSDIANEYLYTGRRLDPETGLQLNRNRFYASHLGRWVNRDPIIYFGGNLYECALGKPTISVDPYGLFACDPSPDADPKDPVPEFNPDRYPKPEEPCPRTPKNPDGSPKEPGQQYEELLDNDRDLIDSREKSKQRDKRELEDEAERALEELRRKRRQCEYCRRFWGMSTGWHPGRREPDPCGKCRGCLGNGSMPYLPSPIIGIPGGSVVPVR